MRKIICCLLFCGTCFIHSYATGKHVPADTNKYRINLPSYWKPGHKAWRILNDKLPMVCTELQDKDLCGDRCNAYYTIDFDMSAPEVLDHYSHRVSGNTHEFVTVYTFQTALLLKNNMGEVITRIVLTDTNETFTVSNKAVLPDYTSAPAPKVYLRKISNNQVIMIESPGNTSVNGIATGSLGKEGQTPNAYLNRNKDKLAPKERDMYAEVNRKIMLLDH